MTIVMVTNDISIINTNNLVNMHCTPDLKAQIYFAKLLFYLSVHRSYHPYLFTY